MVRQEQERSLGKEPERIVAKTVPEISSKNVRCVIIPNSGGLKGIPAGVILGAVAGDASLNMEVLSKVDEKGRARCRELLEADICKVELLDTPVVLHIIIEMYAGEDAPLPLIHLSFQTPPAGSFVLASFPVL